MCRSLCISRCFCVIVIQGIWIDPYLPVRQQNNSFVEGSMQSETSAAICYCLRDFAEQRYSLFYPVGKYFFLFIYFCHLWFCVLMFDNPLDNTECTVYHKQLAHFWKRVAQTFLTHVCVHLCVLSELVSYCTITSVTRAQAGCGAAWEAWEALAVLKG